MNRKEFFKCFSGAGCCALALYDIMPAEAATVAEDDQEKTFIQNWLTDLLDTINTEMPEETKQQLISGCGRGCYRRHSFKHDIVAKGKGSPEKLMEAIKGVMEVWQEGDEYHIRFGETSPGCYCPAAKYREPWPNDLHCYCSAASHQTIWQNALERPVKVDIVEAVRRGGKTCHFVVHLV